MLKKTYVKLIAIAVLFAIGIFFFLNSNDADKKDYTGVWKFKEILSDTKTYKDDVYKIVVPASSDVEIGKSHNSQARGAIYIENPGYKDLSSQGPQYSSVYNTVWPYFPYDKYPQYYTMLKETTKELEFKVDLASIEVPADVTQSRNYFIMVSIQPTVNNNYTENSFIDAYKNDQKIGTYKFKQGTTDVIDVEGGFGQEINFGKYSVASKKVVIKKGTPLPDVTKKI